MRRREFLAVAATAAAFPRLAAAQQVSKVPHVAWLSVPVLMPFTDALPQGLADNGYVVGRDVVIDFFTAPTNQDLPAYAAKVVASSPTVIVSFSTAATQAVQAATSTIPIVFLAIVDPVGAGLVQSLAHPGGNATGFTIVGGDLVGKQISLLKEVVPTMKRVGVLNFPADPITKLYLSQVAPAALPLGIEPVTIDLIDGQDYSAQFAKVLAANVQAVFQPAYAELNNFRDLMFDLYVLNRVPALSSAIATGVATPFPGVICYGANQPGMIRTTAAAQVAAILKGAKPGEIPVEQPTAFDFGVNLDAAKKIGVTIPVDILAQATLVIDYDIRAPKAVAK